MGEERQLRLPGLGSVGYAWNWDLSGADAVAVRLESEPAAHREGEALGCSAPQLLCISGLREGLATVQLFLRRPFSDLPPREQHRIEIEVVA